MIRRLSLALVLAVTIQLPAAAQRRTLDLYWIDVEGGAATLIVTPAGESILVDAGENLDRDSSRIYYVAAKVAGIKQIDHFIATHYHADHYGGINKINQLLPIKKIYDHGNIPTSLPEDPQFSVLMPLYLSIAGGRSIALKPGDHLRLRDHGNAQKLDIECLAANGEVADRRQKKAANNPACASQKDYPRDESDNANSLVLRLKYGNFTFFDGGDLTLQKEALLVCPTNLVGKVDLFQIDHHGLDLSNNPVLIESVQPRVVIINNGPRKGAEPITMKTLWATSSIEDVWQVHRNIKAGDDLNTKPEFIANWQAECKGEFIKASVQPDGSFSVQIGLNGQPKVYRPIKKQH
jgi:competence protein ComEC